MRGKPTARHCLYLPCEQNTCPKWEENESGRTVVNEHVCEIAGIQNEHCDFWKPEQRFSCRNERLVYESITLPCLELVKFYIQNLGQKSMQINSLFNKLLKDNTMADAPDNPFEFISNPSDESAQIDEIADLTVKLLDKRYPASDKILRGVHPKSHGCVKAIFEINNDIEENLQVGLFSTPGKQFQAWIRFSNAAVRIEADLKGFKHGSRGMAIKVLGVPHNEEILQDDCGARNQDFLMINTPSFAFANVQDYLRLTKVIHENNDDPSEFFAPLNPQIPGFSDEERARTKRSLDVVQEINSKPVANPLGVQYFSAAPFLFGTDRVMKFSAVPSSGEKAQLFPKNISKDYLKEALKARMQEQDDVCFDFMLQVRGRDEPGLDIEDATAEWVENEIPFVTVAKITIRAPQTDIDSPENVMACEKRVFTPWHSLASHQPLGSINRLRKKVYIASKKHRDTND